MKLDILNTINNSNLNGPSHLRANKSVNNSTPAQHSSTVQLSEQAMEATTTNEVFDSQKVEHIKTAIAEGRFQVNAQAVADSLLNTALDLIHAQANDA